MENDDETPTPTPMSNTSIISGLSETTGTDSPGTSTPISTSSSGTSTEAIKGSNVGGKKKKKKMTKEERAVAKSLALGSYQEIEEERAQWGKPSIAMSVGLGNVWRFPFIAYRNGGAAFLIVYLIVLFCVGRPLYFMELAIGQFSSSAQVRMWNMSPFFRGVGYSAMMAAGVVVSFYCHLMGLSVFYIGASFAKKLPWTQCDSDWIAPFICVNGTLKNIPFNATIDPVTNMTMNDTRKPPPPISALYFENYVLNVKSLTDEDPYLGTPDWRLVLCLGFSWLIVYMSIVFGIKNSGKVAYFTAIFPYLVLLILLIKGCTLEGAGNGIIYFLKPDWIKLISPTVWYEAVAQMFFSLSTCFGGVIMFASYNPFQHKIYRDAIILSCLDTFTSLLAGFTVFAILGSLAHQTGQDVENVVMAGGGLAFVSYPDAIGKFEHVPQVFSVLFFLMIFVLGVGSASSLAVGIISIICDKWPYLKRWMVTTGVCGGFFIIGTCYTTPAGMSFLDLMDHYGAAMIIFVVAIVEIVAIAYVYGIPNLISDIHFMLGIKLGWYWKICWTITVPIMMIFIWIYMMATYTLLVQNDRTKFPVGYHVFGSLLAFLSLMLIPLFAVLAVRKRKYLPTLKEKILDSLKPNKYWGPANAENRADWIIYKEAHPEEAKWNLKYCCRRKSYARSLSKIEEIRMMYDARGGSGIEGSNSSMNDDDFFGYED